MRPSIVRPLAVSLLVAAALATFAAPLAARGADADAAQTPPAPPRPPAPPGPPAPAAPSRGGCQALPSHAALKAALVAAAKAESSGLNNHMWATVVNRDGGVCAVAFSGTNRSAQWLGSRVISAQKANTANAFSLDATSASNGSGQAKGLALSTANLYSAVQPGGSLYGLQHSNPVDADAAYGAGPATAFGSQGDPLVNHAVGGVNVFGGGLALYARAGRSSAASASAVTRRARTTASRGACATS